MSNQKLLSFINKFKNSELFAAKQTVEFLRNSSTSKIIADYNRKQLSEGKGSDDKELGDYGELRTMQRVAAGKQVGFIDLKFEGDFHESIFADSGLITAKQPGIEIQSNDPKWGTDISQDERFKNALGLTGENRDKIGFMIATYIRNELVKYYKV